MAVVILVIFRQLKVFCLCALLYGLWLLCYQAYFTFDERLLSAPKADKTIHIQVERLISDTRPFYLEARILKVDEISDFKSPQRGRFSFYQLATAPKERDLLIFTGRLKAFHGIVNGSIDSQKHRFYQRLYFTGYDKADLHLISHKAQSDVARLRNSLSSKLEGIKGEHFYKAWLLGQTHGFSKEALESLRFAGLSHLFAISGLHVGLVFIFSVGVLRVASILLPVKQTINLWPWWLLSALVVALFYVLIAGSPVSSMRAWCMLAIAVVLHLKFGLQKSPLWVLAMTLSMILVVFPFSLLSVGTTLSFSAVALIYLGLHYLPESLKNKPKWLHLLWLQGVLVVGLAPISFLFFGYTSLSGLFLNLVLVPLASLVIMPWVFIGTLLLQAGMTTPLVLLGHMLEWALTALESMPLLQVHLRYGALSGFDLALLILVFVAWMIIRNKRVLVSGLSTFVVLKLIASPPSGVLSVFDVGHGLSSAFQTKGKVFLYDTGPKYFNEFDYMPHILPDYLSRSGGQLDTVVISHKDLDHAGGFESIQRLYPKTRIYRFDEAFKASRCRHERFHFYDSDIEVLWPREPADNSNNDTSCVVRLTYHGIRVLFSGDISKKVEAELIKTIPQNLTAEILISGHHGSITSSSKAWVRAVNPHIVIHSSSYARRWPMPHPEVYARFQSAKVRQLITGYTGRIDIRLEQGKLKVTPWRSITPRWYLPPY